MFLLDWRLALLSLGADAVLPVPDLPGRQGPPRGLDRDPEVARRDDRRRPRRRSASRASCCRRRSASRTTSIARFRTHQRAPCRAPDPPGDGRALVLHDHRHDLQHHAGVRVLAGRDAGGQRRPGRPDGGRRSSRSPRSRAGCSSRSASCSTSRSRSRARWPCSTGSSSTSRWTRRSSTRPTRSTLRPGHDPRQGPLPRRVVPLPDRRPCRRSRARRPRRVDGDARPMPSELPRRSTAAAEPTRGGRRGRPAIERRAVEAEPATSRGVPPAEPAARRSRSSTSTSRREPGELVALVGPSGSGKTTTTYLDPAAVRRRLGRGRDRRHRRPPDQARVARRGRSAS